MSAGAHIIASDKTDTLIWRKGVKCTDAVTPVRVGAGDGEKFGGLEISERGRGPIFIAARRIARRQGTARLWRQRRVSPSAPLGRRPGVTSRRSIWRSYSPDLIARLMAWHCAVVGWQPLPPQGSAERRQPGPWFFL